MRLQRWLPILAFIIALGIHFAWSARSVNPGERSEECVLDDRGTCIEDRPASVPLTDLGHLALAQYLKQQDYFLGFSYALALAFAVFAVQQWRCNPCRAAVGGLGSLSLSSALLVAGCFLVGCCGSPMLPLWVGLLGVRWLGLAKPIVAAITALSVVGGYFWLQRGRRRAGCCSQAPDQGEALT